LHTTAARSASSTIDGCNECAKDSIDAVIGQCQPHCHIVETGNDSYRFKHSTTQPKKEKRTTKQPAQSNT